MDFQIVGPDDEVAHDTYDVWIEKPCIGSGKTRIEAIVNAQQELQQLSRAAE